VGTAIDKVTTWVSLHTTQVVREKEEHWDMLRSLLRDAGRAGNLTTDAHLATLAICHGAILVSCDSDFSRFKALRWDNPIA
jgi:predicted nucleic acid-binding protein